MGWYKDKSGNPVWIDDSAPRAVPIGPQNPTYQYQGPTAAEDLRGKGLDNEGQIIDNRVKGATADGIIRKTTAEARKAELEASAAERDFNRGPKLSEAEINAQKEQRARLTALGTLANQLDRANELFQQGPGSTSGYQGIKDYLPTDANKRLDVAGAQLAQQGLAAFRVPGSGTVSDRDAMMFDRANLPQASNFDATTSEQLRSMRARVNEELKAAGQPPRWDENGNPVSENQRALLGAQARLESQIANLPPKAQEIGRRRFYADPAIKRLMGRAGTANAPRKAQGGNVIDFNQWGN